MSAVMTAVNTRMRTDVGREPYGVRKVSNICATEEAAILENTSVHKTLRTNSLRTELREFRTPFSQVLFYFRGTAVHVISIW